MKTINVLYVYNHDKHELNTYVNLRLTSIKLNEYTPQEHTKYFAVDAFNGVKHSVDRLPNTVHIENATTCTLWTDTHDKKQAFDIFINYFKLNIQSDMNYYSKRLDICKQEYDTIVNNDLPRLFGES